MQIIYDHHEQARERRVWLSSWNALISAFPIHYLSRICHSHSAHVVSSLLHLISSIPLELQAWNRVNKFEQIKENNEDVWSRWHVNPFQTLKLHFFSLCRLPNSLSHSSRVLELKWWNRVEEEGDEKLAEKFVWISSKRTTFRLFRYPRATGDGKCVWMWKWSFVIRNEMGKISRILVLMLSRIRTLREL